jgi:hypothetical protein
MISTISMLLLGIVIISTLGSLFGYLLEPGRFDNRGATEYANGLSGAEPRPQGSDHSPRWAA